MPDPALALPKYLIVEIPWVQRVCFANQGKVKAERCFGMFRAVFLATITQSVLRTCYPCLGRPRGDMLEEHSPRINLQFTLRNSIIEFGCFRGQEFQLHFWYGSSPTKSTTNIFLARFVFFSPHLSNADSFPVSSLHSRRAACLIPPRPCC